jgi:AcrR family transcriptional regulator
LVSAILEATAQILEEHGYHGCTTNRIAEKAGVSIGSVYQYFPDKESLVAAVLSEVMWHNVDLFRTVVAREKSNPSGMRTEEIIGAMVERVYAKKKLVRILVEEAPPVVRIQGVQKAGGRYVAFLKDALGADVTESAKFNAEMAAFVIINAVTGVLRAAVVHGEIEQSILTRELSRLIDGYFAI